MSESSSQFYDYRLDPVNDDDDYNLIALINQTGHAFSLARTRVRISVKLGQRHGRKWPRVRSKVAG